MQFGDFEEQIFSIDRAIHREMPEDRRISETPASKDLTELRATLRRAMESLILCNDLDQGIRRLRRQAEACSAIKALTTELRYPEMIIDQPHDVHSKQRLANRIRCRCIRTARICSNYVTV